MNDRTVPAPSGSTSAYPRSITGTMTRSQPSDSGFAIIEVVVSAAVLAIVALAVLSGIDGATGSSAREKARAVAASLAEKDQERLRAMSVETLKAVPQAAPITVDGVTYTIKSEANWVTDDTGGTPACGNSGNSAEYFHITSTVTSNVVGVRIPAVEIDSLVSPNVAYSQEHGTLGVKIVDRIGNGRPGITVSGTGPSALSAQTTDQDGCVLWRSVNIGAYTISINAGGCGEFGESAVTREQTVSPNTVSFVTVSYDQCVDATVNVKTHTPGTPFTTNPASAIASRARDVSDLSSNGSLKTWSVATPSTTLAAKLFPHPAPYGFFTGRCEYESPEKLGIANYFATTNPGASLTAVPGQPAAPVVYQPPVRIWIQRTYTNSPPAAGRADVTLALQKPGEYASDSCEEPPFAMTVASWGATNGMVSHDSSTFDPGLPFGTYKVTCIYDRQSGRYARPNSTYDNTSADGGAALTINIPRNSWTTSPC